MPARNSARGFFLLRFVLCGLLGFFPSQLQAGVSALWGTVINGGPSEYFTSPQAACQRQHDSWAPQAPGPVTVYGTENWRIAGCDWITHMDGGPRSVFPVSVTLDCMDNSSGSWQRVGGYKPMPPGMCVPADEPVASRATCEARKGALPNPLVLDPVIVATGALYEAALDYEDADGRLRIARTYRSSHGYSANYQPSFGAGELWRFNFQWEWRAM